MTKTILFIAAAAIFASCNQGSGDADMYKKQVDSLTKELAARPPKAETSMPATTNAMETPQGGAGGLLNPIDTNGTLGLISRAMMDTATANRIIQNWHKYVRTSLKADTNCMAFMVDARLLRTYVVADPTVTYVIFNIASTSNTGNGAGMTITYVGAKPDPTNGNKLTELPFTIQGDPSSKQYIFEHAFPCPTCGTVGVHPGKPHGVQ